MSFPERRPDFESYSLGELYDVRDHLDEHSYADRLEIVERLIAEKEAAGDRLPQPPVPPVPLVFTLALLGLAVIIGIGYFQGGKAAFVATLSIFLTVGFDLAFLGYLDGSHGDR